jgi:hypothetical protein
VPFLGPPEDHVPPLLAMTQSLRKIAEKNEKPRPVTNTQSQIDATKSAPEAGSDRMEHFGTLFSSFRCP